MKLDADIRKKAEHWANSPTFDNATRREVATLLERGQEDELVERFYRDLEFGTAGLRGIVGPGSSRMNSYNVRKAAFALVQYLREIGVTSTSIALTYDSRKHSEAFAKSAAEVFAASGIKVWLTEKLQPVPLLSFLIRQKKCCAGMAITASHNPPDYNGCKIYWNTGGQIIPPHDQGVLRHYNAVEDYGDIPVGNFDASMREGTIELVGKQLEDAYLESLQSLRLSKKDHPDFKVVFTPLHGTTGEIIPRALKSFGFSQTAIVESQRRPDGNFPTVKFPNPEEKEALALAVEQALRDKAHAVLATDPDGDRIGIAVVEGGTIRYLGGNDIVCLMTEYMLSRRKENGTLPAKPLVVKSITTTPLLNRISEGHGAHVDETLTGFKWICQVIEDYATGARKPAREYVCGGEESFGFLAGHFVRDKDGVGSCCVAAEMLAHFHDSKQTITQVLENIYRRHGVHLDEIYTLTLPGKEGAERIIGMTSKFRHHPPKEIAGIPVVRIRDFETSLEFSWTGTELSVSGKLQWPKSNVLQFYLEDGTRISVRPSGTEPKIKFYFSVREPIDARATDSQMQSVKLAAAKKIELIKNAVTRM